MPDNISIQPPTSALQKTAVVVAVACFFMVLWLQPIIAQPPFPPPNQIQVFNIRGLDFGSFYSSASGGTVTVDPSGGRNSIDVILDNSSIGEPAIFDVVLVPGRLVSIDFGLSTTLFGSNGGEMILTVGPSDKGSSFVTTSGHPFRNTIFIGGKLDVDGNSLPGNYFGTFTVTFIQE